MNTNISTNRSYHGVRNLRNVTVGRTNINGENLLFVGQYQQNNNMTAVFALDENFRCRLALVPGGSRRGFQIRGFDISQNAAGQTIVAAYGRDSRNGFMFSCNLAAGVCARVAGRGQRAVQARCEARADGRQDDARKPRFRAAVAILRCADGDPDSDVVAGSI